MAGRVAWGYPAKDAATGEVTLSAAHARCIDGATSTEQITYMQQLLPFILNLTVIAWLRTAVVARRRSGHIHRWCVEFCFGVLIAVGSDFRRLGFCPCRKARPTRRSRFRA